MKGELDDLFGRRIAFALRRIDLSALSAEDRAVVVYASAFILLQSERLAERRRLPAPRPWGAKPD